MKKNHNLSILVSLIVLLVGGFLTLAACYLGYLAIYMLIESVFFATDPMRMPTGLIRNAYASALLVVYLFIATSKLSDRIKAALLVGPLSVALIATIIAFYLKPMVALIVVLAIGGGAIIYLYHRKKPWIYYCSIVVSIFVAFFYAWPRG